MDRPSLFQPALFHALADKNSVLIAGCGGGYDVYSGIPLYVALRNRGVDVHLSNLTFTNLEGVEGRRLGDHCVIVAASDDTQASQASKCSGIRGLNYFPEYYLSKFFLEVHGWNVPIYTVERTVGAQQLANAYKILLDKLKLDAVVLVDGGTDSLMFGNEERLGTPIEDSTSIAAVHMLPTEAKFLVCLGFGVDHFHGVSHHLFLENTAALTGSGGFMGAFSVMGHTEEAQVLLAAYEYVARASHDSIVCASVCNAIRGRFGNVQESPRTAGSELYINPLMAMYWTYNLTAVTRFMPHIDNLTKTTSRAEVSRVIDEYRESLEEKRKAKPLPM